MTPGCRSSPAVLALAAPGGVGVDRRRAAPPKWGTTVFARCRRRATRPTSTCHQRPGLRRHLRQRRRQRSRVFEWTAGGTLLRSWPVPGQHLGLDHGVQVANQTRDGRLVLLETSRRDVRTLDVRTGRFRRIADLPKGSIPNYATWGPRGALHHRLRQGVIWRVGRAGRLTRWFSAPALEGVAGFGTTGIRYLPRQPRLPDHPADRRRRRLGAHQRAPVPTHAPAVTGPAGSPPCGPRSPPSCPTASASPAPATSTSPCRPHRAAGRAVAEGRGAGPFPRHPVHRRQRLADPVRHPMQRDLPRPPSWSPTSPRSRATPPTRRSSRSRSASGGAAVPAPRPPSAESSQVLRRVAQPGVSLRQGR